MAEKLTPQQVLEQAVQGVMTEKALSKEALAAVEAILEENEDLKKGHEKDTKKIETLTEDLNKANIKISELTTSNNQYIAAEASVKQREDSATQREIRLELKDQEVNNAHTRVNDMKEFLGLVFRNTHIRKTLQTSVVTPSQPRDQYGNQPYPNTTPVTETETVEEE